MADNAIQALQAENDALRQEIEHLKNEMVRLVSRNLDLSERLEADNELKWHASCSTETLNASAMPT